MGLSRYLQDNNDPKSFSREIKWNPPYQKRKGDILAEKEKVVNILFLGGFPAFFTKLFLQQRINLFLEARQIPGNSLASIKKKSRRSAYLGRLN